MIKGKVDINFKADDIFSLTNNGYDIFIKYLGRVGIMNRPWGRRERKLSFGVFQKDGMWFWKDLAKEESGNAIQFVQRYYSLRYSDAIEKIVSDFGLSNLKIEYSKPILLPPREKEYSIIKFSARPFNKYDKEFWGCVGITEEYFNSFDYWAVKEAMINGKRIPIREDEKVYAYYIKQIDRVKLYFPERLERRFITNIPYSYIPLPEEKVDKLYICKSNKDMLVTSLTGVHTTYVQSESSYLFKKNIVDKVEEKATSPIIFFGSDDDGMTKSEKICNNTGWSRVYTPIELLPDNDSYLIVKKYGIESLKQIL